MSSSQGWQREATVVDLSLAGAGLETVQVVAQGERVTLGFASPAFWDPVVIEAVVVWSRPGPVARLGVAFEHTGPSSVLILLETMAALEPGH